MLNEKEEEIPTIDEILVNPTIVPNNLNQMKKNQEKFE